MNLQEIANTNTAMMSDPQWVVSTIESRCKRWFSEGGGAQVGSILYRGVTRDLGDSAITKVRTDRTPMNTSLALTTVWNDAITKSGRVANRTNSMFTSGNKALARGYATGSDTLYVVFPLGIFKYTWSIGLTDWFISLSQLFTWAERDEIEKFANDPSKSRPESLDTKLIPSLRGDDNSMDAAIMSGNEVMIHSREVLMVRESFYDSQVLPLLLKSMY